LNFSLKSSEIPIGLRSQLASVTINFTDNRDYRAVLYFLVGRLRENRTDGGEKNEKNEWIRWNGSSGGHHDFFIIAGPTNPPTHWTSVP
jgi:hypothetical protein